MMKKELRGLDSNEVKKSFELYGNNELVREKKKTFIKRFIENLSDPIIRVLMIALGLQLIFTLGEVNYFEIGGILAAILLSTTVSTISEHRSESAFERMQSDSEDGRVTVMRDAVMQRIRTKDIVIGDIVYLNAGDKIPADGEMIEGKITTDQSSLNGESVEVVKSPGKDCTWDLSSPTKVFRGTLIINGSGVMRVGRVGQGTYYGMVAKDVQTEPRESPLKLRLGKLASQISRLGYVASAVVGLTYLFNAIVIDNGFDGYWILEFVSNPAQLFNTLVNAITLMITMTVVAAPEGLPMMITVVLSANMKRMINDQILVKKLVGIETAGSMNILFTDKTGTLTVGRPTCDRFIYSFGIAKSMGQLKGAGDVYKTLIISAKYNTDVINSDVGGNSTDRAIYEFFLCEECEGQQILSKTPFSSDKKCSSITLKNGKTLIKGAAEMILASSKYALSRNGTLTKFDKESVAQEYYDAVNRGERVIGVAFYEGDISELCFVSLIVLKDKIRPGVHNAVRQAQRAGIQVVMITGDGGETAKSIAAECGIMSQKANHIAMSSAELSGLSDNEIKEIIPNLRVVYRALPQDKTRLVRLSQELDLVVGMTGDGINDSPSLKLADVGFAMGSGTEIAKSASDIVILDDSFNAITKTILYGRTIFKSIRKFITFQLTMNLAACGVSLFGQFFGIDTPITIIQMLWVNIIMDTLGGLAFAGEAPLDYYMREKPKSRTENILCSEMIHQIVITGLFTLGVCVLFLTSPAIRVLYGGMNPTDRFYTAFYVMFIFAGLFNCFSARCSRLWILSNISNNKPFLLIMLLIAIIQIAMVYFGGRVFRCVPLKAPEISFVISLAATVVPFEMVRRLVYKLK